MQQLVHEPAARETSASISRVFYSDLTFSKLESDDRPESRSVIEVASQILGYRVTDDWIARPYEGAVVALDTMLRRILGYPVLQDAEDVLSDLVAEAALLDVSGDSETPPDNSVNIQNENRALRELQLRSIAQQDREETANGD